MLFNQRCGSVEISFGSGIRGFVILSYGYGRKFFTVPDLSGYFCRR
jgi:hypothetical protein